MSAIYFRGYLLESSNGKVTKNLGVKYANEARIKRSVEVRRQPDGFNTQRVERGCDD